MVFVYTECDALFRLLMKNYYGIELKCLTNLLNFSLPQKEQPTKNLKRTQGSVRVVWYNFRGRFVGFLR